MTPKFLTISFLFTWSTVFSQIPVAKKEGTVKAITVDTLKVKKSDTIPLSKNQLADKEVRIIFEDKSKPDYFKYIFPILTLLLGVGVNKFLDYLKDRKQIKKTGERWQAELASLEMPISKQIEYLEEFLLEHNKEVFDVPKLKVATPLNCEIFASLDKSDFVKFIQSSLSKDYKAAILFSSKVNSLISILKGNNENLKLKFNEFLQETSSYTTKLTLGLQELLKEFADYGVQIEKEVKGDPIQHPCYNAILELINKEIMPKTQTGDYDVYELEKNFFRPVLGVLGEFRFDERTKKLADISSDCVSSIKGIKMEKIYLSKNISTLISHYKDDATNLNEILKGFSKNTTPNKSITRSGT